MGMRGGAEGSSRSSGNFLSGSGPQHSILSRQEANYATSPLALR